jgi:hypothetical protein
MAEVETRNWLKKPEHRRLSGKGPEVRHNILWLAVILRQ